MNKRVTPASIANDRALTVKALKEKIRELGLSPERLAETTPISNMTIRRLLKSPETSIVPEKHRVHIERALAGTSSNALFQIRTGKLADVVKQFEIDGARVENTSRIHLQMKMKFKEAGTEIKDLALGLWRYASAKKSDNFNLSRSIAIGALLYFINPFDLIPDSVPVAGYLDDFAVMTLALTQIRNSKLRLTSRKSE